MNRTLNSEILTSPQAENCKYQLDERWLVQTNTNETSLTSVANQRIEESVKWERQSEEKAETRQPRVATYEK